MSDLRPLLLVLSAFALGCNPADDGGDTDTDPDTDGVTDTDPVTDTDVLTACTVTPPATWSAPSWEANTVTALALRAQLDALTGTAMRGAEQGTVTVDEVSDLTALLDAGAPSLSDVISPGFAPVVDDVFGEFVDLVAAGATDLVDGDGVFTPGAAGGVFGTSQRGIHEGGIEVRQLIDKGVFAGAGLYGWAAAQTTGTLDEATIDAIGAAWGANAAMDSTTGLTDSASYANSMGYFGRTVTALGAAKAYAASPDCTAERDAAIVDVFQLWEESMIARAVHYANVASTTMAAASGDEDVASATHELSEGLGLVWGFRGLTNPATGPLSSGVRQISDAAIDAVLDAAQVDAAELGNSTTGALVTDPSALSDATTDIEEAVAPIFSWDAAELAAIRTPTAG